MKGLDHSKDKISVLYDFRLFGSSFSNDDFSSFNNSTKEERLLRNEIVSLKLINRPDVSSRSCESQARPCSRRFTDKPEQDMTTKKFTRKRTMARWCDIRRDILEFFVAQCIWLNPMHSGKK